MGNKVTSLALQHKKYTFIILFAATLLIVVFLISAQLQRSTTNFCRIVKEEKATLSGDVSYEQRITSYKKLEAVSPDAIEADITSIRKGYEELVKNPSNVFGVGFGIIGAEGRRDNYIKSNCKDV